MYRRKDEIEVEGDLFQQCEFYDVRNFVYFVISEFFVVQWEFRSLFVKKILKFCYVNKKRKVFQILLNFGFILQYISKVLI